MNILRKLTAIYKAQNIRAECERKYEGILHNCCCVSNANKALSFMIIRKGPFKNPVLMQIDRPENVLLQEKEPYVIIKDGYCYEMRKEKV